MSDIKVSNVTANIFGFIVTPSIYRRSTRMRNMRACHVFHCFLLQTDVTGRQYIRSILASKRQLNFMETLFLSNVNVSSKNYRIPKVSKLAYE